MLVRDYDAELSLVAQSGASLKRVVSIMTYLCTFQLLILSPQILNQ